MFHSFCENLFLFLYPESISEIDKAGPDLIRPWCFMKAYISDSFIDTKIKFWRNLDSSLKFLVEIFWTKSNFPSKFDFKFDDEDENKHSVASWDGIVKFCHTLLIFLMPHIC